MVATGTVVASGLLVAGASRGAGLIAIGVGFCDAIVPDGSRFLGFNDNSACRIQVSREQLAG